MKNIVKCSKLYAKQHGYKNPKISIHDTAISNTGEDISNSCWAVYVEEKKCQQELVEIADVNFRINMPK